MKLENLNILTEDGFIKGNISFDESIESIEKNEKESSLLLIPGFFDIHTHGGNGYDFNNASSLEEMQVILDFYASNGVTSVFPTLLTDSDEITKEKLKMIYELSKTNKIIKGIHLEGPFLSEEFKGAQDPRYLQPLSIDKFKEYQECAHGLVEYITISPEKEGVEEFVKYLVSTGVTVSLGHSGATFDEATKAIISGARNFTHVMNAMKPIHQHHPSILAAAFYYDECYNEVIVDGIHVHREMVKFIYKIKGQDKFIGITDSLMAAGLKDGEYHIGSVPIIVKDSDCKLKESGVRAGSTLTAIKGYKNSKEFIGINDEIATKLWSLNAAKLLKLDDRYGSIKVGKKADFIILDKEYNIKEVYIEGKKVF